MLVWTTLADEDVMVSSLGPDRSGSNTEGRMYPCPDCEKVFRHPRSYYQHQHVHRGTHSCPGCRKLFSRRWDLLRHLNKNKYGCPARWRERIRPSSFISPTSDAASASTTTTNSDASTQNQCISNTSIKSAPSSSSSSSSSTVADLSSRYADSPTNLKNENQASVDDDDDDDDNDNQRLSLRRRVQSSSTNDMCHIASSWSLSRNDQIEWRSTETTRPSL